MAFDEQLAVRIRRHFAAKRLPVEEKRMMGGLCFMVRGKMCVGVEKDRLMARIGPARETEALARPGCTPMDFTGRPLRGYVYVARRGFTAEADLAYWLDLALRFNPEARSSKTGRGARSAAPTRATRKRVTKSRIRRA